MKSRTLHLVIALVRLWTRIYTARMSPELREARRSEIESDLWEFQQTILRRDLHPIVHVPFDSRSAFRMISVGAQRTRRLASYAQMIVVPPASFSSRCGCLSWCEPPICRFHRCLRPDSLQLGFHRRR